MEGIETLFLDLDREVAPLLLLIFVGFVDIRGVVIDLCYCDSSELIPESVPGNEEDSIIFVRIETYPLLFVSIHIVPVLVVVRP